MTKLRGVRQGERLVTDVYGGFIGRSAPVAGLIYEDHSSVIFLSLELVTAELRDLGIEIKAIPRRRSASRRARK